MKKLLLILVCIGMASAVWGQSSLLKTSSFGIFTNELDAAITAMEPSSGPGFSTLGHDFLLAGLANYDLMAAATTVGAPYIGYYSKGPVPWSIFGYFAFTSVTGEASGVNVANTTANTAVFGAPPTTYQYEYLTGSTTTTYNTNRQFSAMTDYLKFLINLGVFTTGLIVTPSFSDLATAANNRTVEVAAYRLTNVPAAGTPPVTALDYSVTTTYVEKVAVNPSSQSWTITVPFALLGPVQHYAELSAVLAGYDYGNNTTIEYSEKQSAGAEAGSPFTYNRVDETTAMRNPMQFTLNYTGLFPGFLTGDPRNQFKGYMSGYVTLQSGQYITDLQNITTAVPGGGAANTDTNLATTLDTYTLGMALTADVLARASHSVYIKMGNIGDFGIFPEASFEWRMYPTSGTSVPVTQRETRTGADANADGTLNDAGDTESVATYTYTNAALDIAAGTVGAVSTNNRLTASVALPMSIEIKPQGWLFGLTLGARPQLGYQITFTDALPASYSITTEDYAVGVLTNTLTDSTNTIAAADANPTFTTVWTSSVQTLICLNFAFDVIKIDVRLNASNLLDFESLTLQGTIPLN